MADICLLDKSYSIADSKNYHISIQVNPDGVCFCMLDTRAGHYVGFKKYSFDPITDVERLTNKLEEIIDADEELKPAFGSSAMIWATQKSTFVPDVFFDETNLRDYFEFNHPLDELDEIHYNNIEETAACNVFAIPTYPANLFYTRFRGIKYFHQATPFVKASLTDFAQPDAMHLNLNNGFFDIAVKKQGRLVLYNTFLFRNETDLIYYVLYIVNQLGIDPQGIPLTLCGELSDRVAYQETLAKYLPNMMYYEPASPAFTVIFERINRHKYFNLFYLYNCV
ncbi:MAG: DUF3822 family protein [Bacteroidales bacterium]|nr:DUF3822 family protein [Bacteroidales bacterium]